jgi:F-type H+-transporting ATPase subunit b
MFDLNGTFWLQLINFGIFFAILNVVFLRPVGAALKKRREYVDGVAAEFRRYHDQVEENKKEAERRRAAARLLADETIAKARAAAEAEAAGITSELGTIASALVGEARATVAGELAIAKSRQAELSRVLAGELLERATGGNP